MFKAYAALLASTITKASRGGPLGLRGLRRGSTKQYLNDDQAVDAFLASEESDGFFEEYNAEPTDGEESPHDPTAASSNEAPTENYAQETLQDLEERFDTAMSFLVDFETYLDGLDIEAAKAAAGPSEGPSKYARKTDADGVSDAKARYLARKAAKAGRPLPTMDD